MFHQTLAALGLAACAAVAIHMALPRRARLKVDGVLHRLGDALQAQVDRLVGWRRRQRQTRAAQLEADRVIRRAREASLRDSGRPEGEWDGNVYRPKSFDKPKKPH